MADAESIRREADEILSRSEYVPRNPSLLERALDRVGDEIGNALRWIVERLSFGAGGPSGSSAGLTGWLMLAVLVGLLLYFLSRARFSRRTGAEHSPVVRHAMTDDIHRSEWLDRASAAEAEGRWREAVRCRYRATVAALVERRLLAPEPGATSGEHQERFRSESAEQSPRFDQVSGRFEHVWYGGADADAELVAELAAADEAILAAKSKAGR